MWSAPLKPFPKCIRSKAWGLSNPMFIKKSETWVSVLPKEVVVSADASQ